MLGLKLAMHYAGRSLLQLSARKIHLITSTQRAAQDLMTGIRSPRLWLLLAWSDLEARYRRTILGTFWQTLTSAAYIVGLTVIFSTIRGHHANDFILYIAAGYTGFSLISGFLLSGSTAFQRGDPILKAFDLPASIHVFRAVTNEYILFAHSVVIMVAVWIYAGFIPNLNTLLIIPVILLLFVGGSGLAMTLGLLGARFRDVTPTITTLTSFMFLVTPIFWRREDLGEMSWVADYNPFYHVVNLVRAPLMGEAPDPMNWAVCAGMAIISVGIGVMGFLRYRRQLVYWL